MEILNKSPAKLVAMSRSIVRPVSLRERLTRAQIDLACSVRVTRARRFMLTLLSSVSVRAIASRDLATSPMQSAHRPGRA